MPPGTPGNFVTSVACRVWLIWLCLGAQICLCSLLTTLPPCNDTCVAGVQDVGYLYAAVYDPTLEEVHIFADLRDTQETGAEVDGCQFVSEAGFNCTRPGRVDAMYDNHVQYAGYRVVCASPFSGPESLSPSTGTSAQLTWRGMTHLAEIPVTQVKQGHNLTIGACLGTMYGEAENQPQTRHFVSHMRHFDVQHFHIYVSKGDITFDSEGRAWRRPSRESSPSIQGVEWIHVDTFSNDLRWVRGQATHYAHCMFENRHIYKYMVFWDSDEFLHVQSGPRQLPQMLDAAFLSEPDKAAASFIRYTFRSGCNGSEATNPRNAEEWLEQFNMREQISESSRQVLVDIGWGHIANKGDKLIVRPLLVDEFYFHFLMSARPGYSADSVVMPVGQTFLKHIRRLPENDDCSVLTSSMPE